MTEILRRVNANANENGWLHGGRASASSPPLARPVPVPSPSPALTACDALLVSPSLGILRKTGRIAEVENVEQRGVEERRESGRRLGKRKAIWERVDICFAKDALRFGERVA